MVDESVRDILHKYERKLGENIDFEATDVKDSRVFSREYDIFRNEALDRADSFYENAARLFGNILTIKLKPEDEKKINDAIEISHLHIKPSDAVGFALFSGAFLIAFAILLLVISYVIGSPMLMIPLLLMILGAVIIKPLSKFPVYLANKRRLAASNQMVVCILYIIIYMRHTSNLEHAIKFAGEHIGNPLALDLRKIFWDVETDKFSTIKESIDNYLEGWRDYNLEFVESFHLIEGSLYEGSEEKRIDLLEKALQIILEGTHERMLHFAHDLKSPMTILYMLGIVLPILGLVLFPLVGSFLQGIVKWWHLAILYNLILPIAVFIFGYNMLIKRPTGYSENIIVKTDEKYGQGAKFLAAVVFFVFFVIGILPVVLHFTNPELDQASFGSGALSMKYFDYKCNNNRCLGPYGSFALILSLFIPVGIAIALGVYYKLKTKELIIIREKTKNLEKEFVGSLFQLGNRVGGGIPVEIAFSKVADDLRDSPTGEFFRLISVNLTKFGMGLKEAIFNKDRGAILFFPSGLVETSMKVLLESARRGPIVISKSMMSISEYVNRIHAVNERLKDLLADVTSSMKSQVTFMTPMIAGIVVGVASMVVSIINKLTEQLKTGSIGTGDVGGVAGLLDLFKPEYLIPGYHFQLVVGFYVIQIIIILSYLGSTIENGVDDLAFKNGLSKNLLFGAILYFAISLIGILVFNVLAGGINLVSGG
ncbi:hypothetical protein J4409_01595 [Candidatus Woesearchaeota archaeon]|nr:hypothetical protein [Candidatus Woesearchaeota archaeon]